MKEIFREIFLPFDWFYLRWLLELVFSWIQGFEFCSDQYDPPVFAAHQHAISASILPHKTAIPGEASRRGPLLVYRKHLQRVGRRVEPLLSLEFIDSDRQTEDGRMQALP